MERFKKILVDFIKGRTTAEQGQQELAGLITAHPELTQSCIQQINHLYSSRRLVPQHYSMFRDALTRPQVYCTVAPGEQAANEGPSDVTPSDRPDPSGSPPESSALSGTGDEELDPLAVFDKATGKGIPPASPTGEEAPDSSVPPDAPGGEEEGNKTVFRMPTQGAAPAGGANQGGTNQGGATQGGSTEGPGTTGGGDGETRFRQPTTGHRSPTGTYAPPGTQAPHTGTGSSWGSPSGWTSQGSGIPGEPLTTGSVVKDRFVLEELIGRGGMGMVYKACDIRKQEAQDRNPYVALKVLNEEFKQHPESLKALQRESRKAQDLAHPNIVNVYDFDRDGDNVYMTMELLVGEPLDDLIRRRKGRGLDWDEALPIIKGMSLALDYAHRKNIIHSDFKPGNCFYTENGGVKVFDFGIARAAKRSGDLKGEETKFDAGTLGALTPAYATCEMIDGEEPDQRDDVYALACSSYELLSGRHPYDKLSASEATRKGLVPKPVQGLSRSRFKALQHGLALTREGRTPTAFQFLEEINPKETNKWLKAGAATVAVVALIIVSLVVVPNYLYKINLERIGVGLVSEEFTEVSDAIVKLDELEPNDRQILLSNFSDEIIASYDGKIGSAFNRDASRFDYPAARKLLDELTGLYKDSSRVINIEEQIERDRQEMQAQLSDDYDGFLESRQLLPQDSDDIYDLRDIVAKIDPGDQLLSDARLPQALAVEARVAAETLQFDLAQRFITEGLKLAPDDSNLINVQDEVTAQRTAIERASEIAALETAIESLGERRLEASDLESAQVRQDIRDLVTLQPASKTLKQVQQRVQEMVARQVSSDVGARDWNAAAAFLTQLDGIVAENFIATQSELITTSRREFQSGIDTLVASLDKAIADGRLDQPANRSALSELTKLRSSGAEQAVISAANDRIANGYINAARLARSTNAWDEARELASKAAQLSPSSNVLADVQAEIAKVDNQETLAVQELRAQEIEDMQARVDQRLSQAVFGEGDIDAVAAQLAELTEKFGGVDEVTAFVEQAQGRIADRVSTEAVALARAARWNEANALIVAGESVIGQQNVLSETRVQISTLRGEQEGRQRQEQIRVNEEKLAELLKNPDLDQEWNTNFDRQLAALEKLESGNVYAVEARGRAASLHLRKAVELREDSRWVVAEQQLARAQALAPSLPAVRAELVAFESGRADYEAQLANNKVQAEIDAKRQLFSRQVQAERLDRASATLTELKGLLEADDEFLTTTGPKALIEGRLKTAEASASGDQFTVALSQIEEARKLNIDDPRMAAATERYTAQRAAYNVTQSGSDSEVRGLASILNGLKSNVKDFDDFENRLERVMKRRIEGIAQSNRSRSETLFDAAKVAFPSININWPAAAVASRPAPDKPVPTTRPVPDPVVVTPTPTSTPVAIPTRVAAGAGKACKPGNAGRGKTRTCYDDLNDGERFPILVVIPGLSGSQPFSISRSEVSLRDFNLYCKLSKQCSPLGGKDGLPATNLDTTQMEAYAQWLSSVTGKQYRLPSLSEWRHAATADGSPLNPSINCVRREGGRQADGFALQDVGMGGKANANAWGLRQVVGNAEEVVTQGGQVMAAGGAYSDRVSDCTTDFVRPFGGPNERTGFRVVRNTD